MKNIANEIHPKQQNIFAVDVTSENLEEECLRYLVERPVNERGGKVVT